MSQSASPPWLPIIFFGAAIGLVVMTLSEKESAPKTAAVAGPKARSEAVQESVNRHLEMTAQKLQMERQRMQVENESHLLQAAPQGSSDPYQLADEGAELKSQDKESQVASDLGRNPARQWSDDPHNVIQGQIYEAELNRVTDRAYKEEYARQFVENARRGGYEVKLDAEYQVISVKPIRQKPSQPQYRLFQPQ